MGRQERTPCCHDAAANAPHAMQVDIFEGSQGPLIACNIGLTHKNLGCVGTLRGVCEMLPLDEL